MVVWFLLVFGAFGLPMTTFLHGSVSADVVEVLTILSTLVLFVAICALDGVGTGPARKAEEAN